MGNKWLTPPTQSNFGLSNVGEYPPLIYLLTNETNFAPVDFFKNDSAVVFDPEKTSDTAVPSFRSQSKIIKLRTTTNFDFSKAEAIQELGFSKDQISHFETLAKNAEIVEQVKAEAREENRAPTQTEVLNRVKMLNIVRIQFWIGLLWEISPPVESKFIYLWAESLDDVFRSVETSLFTHLRNAWIMPTRYAFLNFRIAKTRPHTLAQK